MMHLKTRHPHNKNSLLLLPIALCGFALAQPVYHLLLATPMFLLARQNTALDVWALTILLSLVLPLVLALPGRIVAQRRPRAALYWCWALSTTFAALFCAQILQTSIGHHLWLFLSLSVLVGGLGAWLLIFTRWKMLTPFLLAIALMFPCWFLLQSKTANPFDSYSPDESKQSQANGRSPDIVFLVLDELPLATLLDNELEIDKALFPNFARLEAISTWYVDTTTVSDGTVDGVPAILTSHNPRVEASDLTVAARPINLFTILGERYQLNVAESVTRLCPDSLCPRTGPGDVSRFKALALDLSAIYLHRVSPDRWQGMLPDVTGNWSGFFAEKQIFFPDGWLHHTGQQTIVDRPAYFRQFIQSIHKQPEPSLNFMHILLPHPPLGYLPDGRNYGLQWVRGQLNEQWGDIEWGIISAKQRHYFQVQFVDKLLGELLDRLEQQEMLQESLIVIVADHGVNFSQNDIRRALSDSNATAMLQVPLFIKYPGQMKGVRIQAPVSTVDILPTVASELEISTDTFEFDGIDLRTEPLPEFRQRRVSSYLNRELQVVNESDLDVQSLVQENRAQLKLDEPQDRLWNIGPFDSLRGQAISSVCQPATADIEFHLDGFSPLPNSDPAKTIKAFVAGKFAGPDLKDQSSPFLITSNDIVVASGDTWKFNDDWLFFALVEPTFVERQDWSPKAWLVDSGNCLTQ